MIVRVSDGRLALAVPAAGGGTKIVYLGRKPESPVDEQSDRRCVQHLSFELVTKLRRSGHWDGSVGTLPDEAMALKLVSEFTLKGSHDSESSQNIYPPSRDSCLVV